MGLQVMKHLFTAQAELCQERPAIAGQSIDLALKLMPLSLPTKNNAHYQHIRENVVLMRVLQLLQLGDIKALLEGQLFQAMLTLAKVIADP